MLFLSAEPEHDHHDTGPHHPERPQRVPAVLNGIERAGVADGAVHLPPRTATREELERVHTPEYLRMLEDFCAGGGGALDVDTVASPGSWETALRAVGGALAAVDALTQAGDGVAFIAYRPPGHHATADQAMGFCLLNTVAVAAAALLRRGERVLVLDWDVHHGNGTQDIFWEEPNLLYVSTHQSPLYPGTGQVFATGGAGAPGLTLNIPLPPGATGDVLLYALDEVVAPAVAGFGPTWVLVSSGFDAHRSDPLAQLALSAGDFGAMAARAKDFAPRPGRALIVLEGGYDLAALSASTGAVLAAMLGESYHPEPATSGGPGREAVDQAGAAHQRARAEGS
ncbi:MAG TPA: histone deacetylase [Acidimicrobiales bacterium]|nr:histone deacetylase [Acidimicrobiales bacterium]